MTPAEMITEIDDYGFDDVASARKYAAFNDALADITTQEPWPWRETVTTLSFIGSVASPVEVSTIGKPIAITNPSTGDVLEPMRSEEFQKRFGANLTDSGVPTLYYFDSYSIKFWPVPTSSVTLTCRHIKDQAILTSSSTEAEVLMPPRYHWAIIFRTLARLYAKADDDIQMSQFFQAESDKKVAAMIHDAFMRWQYDRADTIYISSSEDWDWD